MKENWTLKKKLSNYLKITGILNKVFRPQQRWTVTARDASRITAAEMDCYSKGR
jgi:hypothetical protein